MISFSKKQAFRGVVWSAVERFSVQGIQFLLSILIARFVMPSEYGLIAMLGIFLAIAQTFIDSGFSNALIQKKNRTEEDLSTVFYFNIVIAITIYAFFYSIAPAVASFYEEPRLCLVARWTGLSLIINALSIVQRAKLTICLDFKSLAKVSLLSVLLSGMIGLYLAYMGYGVWALVVQSLINSLLNTVFLFVFTNWIPKLVFSWESFRSLFSFGSKLLLSGLMHTIYTNLYSLVIGKKYTSMDVGLYNRANQFAIFPSANIVSVIMRAIYPVQCQNQDNNERLRSSFIQYLRLTCIIVFPLMMFIVSLSEPLIRFLLTDKWIASADLLAILSFAYMWCPVMMINNQILNVKGRSDFFLQAEIVKKVVAIVILLVTLPYGVKMLCFGMAIYSFADMLIIIHFVKKVMKTGYIEQAKNLFPIFLISVLMALVIYVSSGYLHCCLFLNLILMFALACLSYILLGVLFRIPEFLYMNNYLKSKIG